VSTHAGVESAEVHLEHQVEGLSPGEYLYVRVRQADGGVAWSSPFFVVGP